jgi:anti-sigma regulatory factor (Ser/Thr protein kinase)
VAVTAGPDSGIVETTDASTVGDLRRRAIKLARELGLGQEATGRVGLVATELAGNVWKHARGQGWCHLGARRRGGAPYVRIVCADRGSGIADIARALQDGFSTSTSPGNGLGAVRRLSRSFDLFTSPGAGTVVTAEVGEHDGGSTAMPPALAWDGVAIAKAGQERNGDAWGVEERDGRLWVVLADGLGHGSDAAVAAELAVAIALRPGAGEAGERIAAVHAGLRSTRGAAVALAAIDPVAGSLRFSGIGNVTAVLEDATGRHNLVSMNGTAGHHARTVREFGASWRPESLLILHTDGLTSRWDLAARPGLAQRHPATIAATLLRDFARGNDDAAAVVVKRPL